MLKISVIILKFTATLNPYIKPNTTDIYNIAIEYQVQLTLYDPGGGGGFKSPHLNFSSRAFNFGATLLCVGDFSQK